MMSNESPDGDLVEAIGELVASFIAVSPEVDLEADQIVFHGNVDLFEELVTRAIHAALQVVPSELLAKISDHNKYTEQILAFLH